MHDDVAVQLLQFKRAVEGIERIARAIGDGSIRVFRDVSQPTPRLDPAELGFLRTISMLYVYLFEAGREGVEFLVDKLDRFALDDSHTHREFLERVRELRTFTQHNLLPESAHDRETQRACEAWFRDACGTAVPETDEHWLECLRTLLASGNDLVGAMKETIRRIELDESREEMIKEWLFRRDRYRPPREFDELVSTVSRDMGLAHLDPVRVRQRFFDRWSQELALLLPECDPEREARKIVERSLLSEMDAVLPITGNDIMNIFDIPPGLRVRELLLLAREIYLSQPCTKDVLLARLTTRIGR